MNEKFLVMNQFDNRACHQQKEFSSAWPPSLVGPLRFFPLSHSVNRFLWNFKSDCCDKPTGLEDISNQKLLELCSKKGAFSSIRGDHVALIDGPHLFADGLLTTTFLSSPFCTELRSRLSDKPLVELGIGAEACKHATLTKEFFGVSDYVGIDHYKALRSQGEHINDALLYLATLEPCSTNIVAFDFFTEHLSPGSFFSPSPSSDRPHTAHVEHEYIRRLTCQIRRVLPHNGILFGQGIRPFGFCSNSASYITRAGLREDLRCEAKLSDSVATHLKDVFFYY